MGTSCETDQKGANTLMRCPGNTMATSFELRKLDSAWPSGQMDQKKPDPVEYRRDAFVKGSA